MGGKGSSSDSSKSTSQPLRANKEFKIKKDNARKYLVRVSGKVQQLQKSNQLINGLLIYPFDEQTVLVEAATKAQQK